jgi:hypothetical protein
MQSGKLECLALAPVFDAVLISDAEVSANQIRKSFGVRRSASVRGPSSLSSSEITPK